MTTGEVNYWLNQLALSESEGAELMELILNRSAGDNNISKGLFFFTCIERNTRKIKELEEKLACTKVGEKS